MHLYVAFTAVIGVAALAAEFFTDAEDPTGWLNMIWPFVGLAIPWIVGRATTADAAGRTKRYLSIGIAVIGGVVSVMGTDWTTASTFADIAKAAGGAFMVSELLYHRMDEYFLQRSIDDGAGLPTGFNEQRWLKPQRGWS